MRVTASTMFRTTQNDVPDTTIRVPHCGLQIPLRGQLFRSTRKFCSAPRPCSAPHLLEIATNSSITIILAKQVLEILWRCTLPLLLLIRVCVCLWVCSDILFRTICTIILLYDFSNILAIFQYSYNYFIWAGHNTWSKSKVHLIYIHSVSVKV